MIANSANRFRFIRLIPRKLLFSYTYAFTKPRISSSLIYKIHNRQKLILCNRYNFSQNQPNLNSFPKSSSHKNDPNLKSQNQKSSLNPNTSIPQTTLSCAVTFLKNSFKNKIYNSYKAIVRGVTKIFKAAAFLVFLMGIGYVCLFLLILALYVVLAFRIIIRLVLDKHLPSKQQISQLYNQQKSTLNKLLKIDRLIPTVKKAENAVLDKIHDFHGSRVKILLRTQGLVIAVETMKKVKSNKRQVKTAKVYPFYLRKRMFL